MTRTQRRVHAIAWTLLLPAVLLGLYLIVRARPSERFEPPPISEATP